MKQPVDLGLSSIPFRKTHDLQELMDLLIDNNKTLPPNAEKLDALNPYAVLLRYDFIDLKGVDRTAARELDYLKADEDMAEYLEAAIEAGDPSLISAALGDIARAKGMSRIAAANEEYIRLEN